jgi:hypothetical protein
MFGVLLAGIGSFFEELSGSIGKWQVERKRESVYTMGFLNVIWVLAFYMLFVAADPRRFVFSAASLPFVGVRAVLEIAQGYATMEATALADRSTFNFIRTLTMPLLLTVDLFLGYVIGARQALGIGLILLALVILFMNYGLSRRGAGFTLFSAVNAVATISLYKYDITHFNSVAAEQIVILGVLLAYFFMAARVVAKEHPLKLLARKEFAAQSATFGVGSFIESFAYAFAPASVILSAKRSFGVLWSILTGNRLFKEKRFGLKLLMCLMVTAGIVLLIR